jgi:hypothetical protein
MIRARITPDDKLLKVAIRYGFTVEQLLAFRDAAGHRRT